MTDVRFHTPLVSDVMDELGLPSGVLSSRIRPILEAPSRVILGRAFPCRVEPTDEYVEIDTLLEMVDAIPPGAFVLVAATADIDAALWGGLMSTRAQARGAVGAAVNGGVRDIAQIAELDFPVFGVDRRIRDIRRRGFMSGYNLPVEFDGIPVRPGDGVVADANGVVVIPQEHLDTVMSRLQLAFGEEEAVQQGLLTGGNARDLFNSHHRF